MQQAQGRVAPTTQSRSGVPVNGDQTLEHEAEVMGERALTVGQSAATVQRVADQNNADHLFTANALVDHTTDLVLRADRLNKPTAGDLGKHQLNEGKEVKAKKANAGSTWLAGTNTGQSLILAEAHVPGEKVKGVKVVKSIPASLEIRQTSGLHQAELVTKVEAGHKRPSAPPRIEPQRMRRALVVGELPAGDREQPAKLGLSA